MNAISISDAVSATDRVLVVTYQQRQTVFLVCQDCEKEILKAHVWPKGPDGVDYTHVRKGGSRTERCSVCGANREAIPSSVSATYWPRDPAKCAAYIQHRRRALAADRGGTVTQVGPQFGWEASLGDWTSATYGSEDRAWAALLDRCGI